MPENAWGWMIVAYLFLAGAGAGAFLTAAAGKTLAPDWSRTLAKAGSLAAGPLVTIGTLCLVLDLEAGLWQPWRQIYLVSNLGSMISWGVLILSVFIPVAILYAAALNDIPILGKFAARYEKALLVVGSILAICTAGYTGVLIAVVNGVPFWNTPLMPVLFLASAVSTGLAGSAILASIMDAKSIKNMSNFAYGHMVFLILEAVVLVLFIVMSATRSTETAFSAGLLISGVLSPYFWLFVVFLGILVPLVVSAVEYFQLKHLPKALILTVDACVLLGGLSLRAVIVFSGVAPQIL